nr:hypothetical protein HK105_006134 [Polyrhizophydium stewartii]
MCIGLQTPAECRLYYYQGFHDVCAVLQLVLGERLARAAAPNLALIWLRDFMEPNLSSSMKHVECIHPILLRGDPELYRFLAAAADAGGGGKGGAEAFHTWFAVSWVLTWLSHDVRTINEAMRLMDLFLCSGPLMPVYASAAIVISARAKLLGLDPDELDMAVIHSTVVKLPGLPGFDVEKVATLALDLYERIPPETLNLATRVGQDSCVLRYRQDYLAVEDPGEAFDADAIRAVFTKRCADKPKSFLPPWMRQKPSRRTIALVVLGGSVLLATVLLSTLQSGLLVDHFSL